MATRSDFAQKLLTDLRTRKERMVVPASQNTSNSKGMSRDSYANPSQFHKGSRQTKPFESVGTRAANTQKRSNHGARSIAIGESSQQLVPYGGGQNSEKIKDLSRALAFAFENKGNFMKSNSSSNNPILSFLHRIGIRKMEKRNTNNVKKLSSQTINLSNIHINEISKGAQKLNQILRACSNGINFDGYSVEMGRELLKGAMDLEESLRMLANLQEASEQVINPKRKSRIKLLDENGEEVEDERETNSLEPQDRLVERPRFSFDQPLRNSRGTKKVIKSDPIRSLMALSLTYTTEAETSSGKQPSSTSDVASHKRSASYNPDFRPEKGRLPNVIAKLMGLEEVPQSVNFETTSSRSSLKQKEGICSETDVKTNGKTVDKNSKTADYVAHAASKRKVVKDNSFKVPNLVKSSEVTKSVPGSQFTENFPQFIKNSNDLHVKIKKQETKKHEEDIGLERGPAKRMVDHYHKDVEAKIVRKGANDSKKIGLEREKRNTDREEKPQVEKRDKQHMKEKYHIRKEKGIVPKPKNEVQTRNRSSKELQSEKPYTVSTNSKIKTDLIRNRRNLIANAKKLMFVNSIPKEIVPETKNSRGCVPPIKEEKHVHTIATERMRHHVEVPKRESPQRKDEVMIERNGTQQKTEMTFEDQTSPLQKRKQPSLASSTKGVNLSESNSKEAEVRVINPKKLETRTKLLIEHVPTDTEAEARIVSPKKSEASTEIFIEDVSSEKELEVHIVNPKKTEASMDLLIEDLPSEKEAAEDPTINSSKGSELQSPIVGENLANPSESFQSKDTATEIFIDPIDNEDQLPSLDEDSCQESQKLELHPENGCNEARQDNYYPQQHEQKNPISEDDELLTESEIHLKKTLLRSRLFLNTAEAVFNLSIPADICHVTECISQDDTSKIMLDCAYEIMRRKGKRQELSLYPLKKISNLSFKVTSFHDLVKQLYTDLEKFKVIYEDTSEEQNTAESIQEMLERDVQNRDMDVNPVWDLGWNEVAFAVIERIELIKDLEGFLIDRVIEDIAKELLHLNAYIYDS